MKHRTGFLFKRGSNWYVQWRIDGKLRMKALRDDNGQPITTKPEAEQARAKFMSPLALADEAEALSAIASKSNAIQVDLDKQEITLSIPEVWSAFEESTNRPDSGPETMYQYRCQWSRFADWVRAKHPEIKALRDVTRKIADEYIASLNHGTLSPNTFNKHLGLLTLVFRVLREKAKLTINPWEDIKRKRLTTNSRRELTIDELRNVCQSATGELRTLLALGVYSGLRLGDCATLRWGEVDLKRNMIRRIPNKIARSASARTVQIPIHPVLHAMLTETPAAKRGEHVLPETASSYRNRTDIVTDQVQAHFKKCGINPHKHGTGTDGNRAVVEVGFHSLRHTFVSLCRESNAPLAVVEAIVGHSNPAMTRHYTHVGELAASNAVAALPALIGDAKPAQVKLDADTLLAKVHAIASSMTAKNWGAKKAELLVLGI